MREKKCFCIGHRDACMSEIDGLDREILRHIEEYAVTEFIVGNYGNFDGLVAAAVLRAKKKHPWVRLTLLLPYHPGERRTELPPGFDGSLYPDGMETVPRRLAIIRANRRAVDMSQHMIAFVWHPASNSREILAYARAREKKGGIRVCVLSRRT